jgi:hypothetical protein
MMIKLPTSVLKSSGLAQVQGFTPVSFAIVTEPFQPTERENCSREPFIPVEGNEDPAHQHSLYCPPAALMGELPQLTSAPLPSIETNSPIDPNRGSTASTAQVSSTMK